ncbi:MAG: glycosyltransferase [Acidimicrobiales bacterium]
MSGTNASERPKSDESLKGYNICVIYDCLFPLTHGGAERWYRYLVDRVVATGATVTFLTRRQWTGEAPSWSGVTITGVSSGGELYDEVGTRRTGPAVRFGLGTFSWMIRHRRGYDAVIVASFPFFSFLASRSALAGTGTPIFVDYHEVWSAKYWRSYAGRFTGVLGAAIQRLCISLTRFAQVFTAESARRLKAQGLRGNVIVLAGLLPEVPQARPSTSAAPEPVVLFVGRHVQHKGVRLLPEIFAATQKSLPSLQMVVVGDGPERARVEAEVARLGLTAVVSFTGAVSDEELGLLYARASCTIVPSFREGYGMVVAESAAAGTPVVVADYPENLATSLVVSGVNGYVVDPSVTGISRGIAAAIEAGQALRESTGKWSEENARSIGMNRSADEMIQRLAQNASRRNSGRPPRR